eukprot:scaffold244124_cov27-Tisochrysis_lutea.AAC.1
MAPSSERHAYPLRSFAAGAAAGALDTCVTMPLDTIKTQMQIRAHRSVSPPRGGPTGGGGLGGARVAT